MIELLLGYERAPQIARRLEGTDIHAPHLLDIEVTHVLRRVTRLHGLSSEKAEGALAELALFSIERHSHIDLLPRIWELRHNLTAYDGAYVSLAEALDAPLITLDKPLSGASGHEAKIELIE